MGHWILVLICALIMTGCIWFILHELSLPSGFTAEITVFAFIACLVEFAAISSGRLFWAIVVFIILAVLGWYMINSLGHPNPNQTLQIPFSS